MCYFDVVWACGRNARHDFTRRVYHSTIKGVGMRGSPL